RSPGHSRSHVAACADVPGIASWPEPAGGSFWRPMPAARLLTFAVLDHLLDLLLHRIEIEGSGGVGVTEISWSGGKLPDAWSLPQLRNDLFRLVSLPCHCSPP